LNALDRFREVNRAFPKTSQILEHKSQGKKVFGWLCTYVPEEIIHAAGALPIRIIGDSHEAELDEGNAYLYINNCSFSRSCLQMGLRGDYDYLDGVIAGSTCDGARRLFDLWGHYIKVPFHHILTVPRKYTERAQALYYEQFPQTVVTLFQSLFFTGTATGSPYTVPFFLDIRSDETYENGHLCGTLHVLLKDMFKSENLMKLPLDRQILVYSDTGHEGAAISTILNLLGYDAINLRWGITSWSLSLPGKDIAPERFNEDRDIMDYDFVTGFDPFVPQPDL